jgi:hypothetical protein
LITRRIRESDDGSGLDHDAKEVRNTVFDGYDDHGHDTIPSTTSFDPLSPVIIGLEGTKESFVVKFIV